MNSMNKSRNEMLQLDESEISIFAIDTVSFHKSMFMLELNLCNIFTLSMEVLNTLVDMIHSIN
jgi:hypothetical protein